MWRCKVILRFNERYEDAKTHMEFWATQHKRRKEIINPNPHCFIATPKPLLVAEKSHYYPTPCTVATVNCYDMKMSGQN
jgi:hypothetical protein